MGRKISSRAQHIDSFIVMDMLRLANQHQKKQALSAEKVLHLELGEPVSTLPKALRDRLNHWAKTPIPGYSDAVGWEDLRRGIARWYQRRDGLDIDPECIAVTTGSSAAFVLAFLAVFDPGDRVAITVPGYPAYPNILRALGCQPVTIETRVEDHFQPRLEDIAAIDPVPDGLILSSPSNPTGTVMENTSMRAIANYCRRHDIRLISDEIYRRIVYDGMQPASMAAYDDEAIVIDGFSKYFLMPGWRLGWMVVPRAILRSVEKIAQNLYVSPPSLSQRLALDALDQGKAFDDNVSLWDTNRRLLTSGIQAMGFRPVPAQGAFYLYAEIDPALPDSLDLCREILGKTGVALTPGMDFDPKRGHRWLRFSYSGEYRIIQEALMRLQKWHGEKWPGEKWHGEKLPREKWQRETRGQSKTRGQGE